MSSVFNFKSCHFKALDDYVTLHNLSMLLTYIVTFTMIYNGATRDVVIVSLHGKVSLCCVIKFVNKTVAVGDM